MSAALRPLGCLLKPLLHSPQYRRVRDSAVVDGRSIDDRDGVEQAPALNLIDGRGVFRFDGFARDVVVDDLGTVAVATFQLVSDDARDLLRRP